MSSCKESLYRVGRHCYFPSNSFLQENIQFRHTYISMEDLHKELHIIETIMKSTLGWKIGICHEILCSHQFEQREEYKPAEPWSANNTSIKTKHMIAFLAPAILDIVLMLAKFQLYFSFLYGARVLSSQRGYDNIYRLGSQRILRTCKRRREQIVIFWQIVKTR
jgi:hypothetical protein